MKKITKVIAREILDSRGNPTIEVDLTLADGSFGRAAVPSGASTGSYEAVELRDGEKRYGGKGVLKAVFNVNGELKKALVGKEFDQKTLDKKMIEIDGTENKGRLGANAILGISMAFAHATAKSDKMPPYKYFKKIGKTGNEVCLPVPMMNIINGGKHAENSTDLQEFMIMPIGAKTFAEALRMGAETFHALKKILKGRKLNVSVGDEGGYAPALPNNEAAIQVIIEAIEAAGYKAGKDISIAIDGATSELFDKEKNKYILASENKEFKCIVVKCTKKLGKKIQIVGDDLFVTNVKKLQEGIEKKAGNSILIKLNQIGTVTETIDAINMAKKAGYTSVVSHRSGETEDVTIADLVVGLGTGQIKTGSLCRSERVAKYNQLLRIEQELGAKAVFPGKKALKI